MPARVHAHACTGALPAANFSLTMATHVPKTFGEIPQLLDTAVTAGSYDGVHLGHRAMADRVHSIGAERGLASVLVTFHPHHRVFFGRADEPFMLTDLEEKLALLSDTRMDHLVVLPFVSELAGMDSTEFMQRVLVEALGARLFLVGHDQAIGRDQIRGPESLSVEAEGMQLEVESIDPVALGAEPVSSTAIRGMLMAGDVRRAREALGAPYTLGGRVVHGDGRGRELGYPTANLEIAEPFKLVPAPGIYAIRAEGRGVEADGMLYVGNRPTFGQGARAVEAFLMDYEGDLYGRTLRVHLLERLRGDVRFESADDLARQMRADEVSARRFFEDARRALRELRGC